MPIKESLIEGTHRTVFLEAVARASALQQVLGGRQALFICKANISYFVM